MRMNLGLATVSCIAIFGSMLAVAFAEPAKPKQKKEEQERVVKEAEVPAPALAALKKLAGGAAITKFEENIENGDRFYEGAWKTPDGSRIEGLVTAAGDLVEMEEVVASDVVPKAVLEAAQKVAGKDAKLFFEKETEIKYEVKFMKNGKRHEVVFSPTGRQAEHEESSENEKEED